MDSHTGDRAAADGPGRSDPPASAPRPTAERQSTQQPAEQQRTEQQRTEQQRTEQQRTEQQRTEQQRTEQQRTQPAEQQATANEGPSGLSKLGKGSWWGALKRSGKQVGEDNLTTWAAALTYYGILSIFPALLVLVSVLGLVGHGTEASVTKYIHDTAPGTIKPFLDSAIQNVSKGQSSSAGVLAIVGILGALWSASGYIGSFMQASNAIYDVPEGRPFYKKVPIRLALTVVTGVIVAGSALAIVLTGSLARRVGNAIGLGSQAVTVWDIAKWPVLVILISLIFAILYWAAPNAKHGGFRWVTPGSLLAVLIWIIASGLFALYVTNFGSYNKTYGAVAGIIIFLVWLWITNLAILFGAEFDAELQRSRAIAAGRSPQAEPYMELRDTKKVDPEKDSDL